MSTQLDDELGRLAVVRGVATAEEVRDCLRVGRQSAVPMNLAQVMLQRGLVTQRQVNKLLQQIGAGAEYAPPPSPRIGCGATFGRYHIVAEIGRGGMGAVYKAVDPELDRTVALKILSDRLIASDEDIHRFQRESKLAARLRHPHLVQVYEAGVHLEGTPFFTMEFIEGQTLDQILIDEMACSVRPDWEPPLTRDDKLRVMIKTAEAVHHIHRAGIIHRDIKPGNIIVDACKEPHLTDFGLAREIRSHTMLTHTGTAMGTPYYMAPEQAAGDVHHLDARTDVYALGAVLYHALTLKLPYMEATAAAVLRKVIDEDPIAPRTIDPSIPVALERIVQKAMAKDPRERYVSAGEFARDLERYLLGQPVGARGPTIVAKVRRWVRRHPAPASAIVVAAALLTVFASYLFFRPGRLTVETTPAGAEAFVDERAVGPTPIDLSLSRGRHEVRVSKHGYRDLRFIVDIGGGRSEVRKERLEQRLGRVTIESEPSPAEVRLDGPSFAVAPGAGSAGKATEGKPKRVTLQTPVETLTLPAGVYRVEVFRPQHELATLTMEIGDRSDAGRRVVLREALRWQFRALDGIWRAPAIVDANGDGVKDVIVAARDGRVYALSGRDGHALWTHETRAPNPTEVVVAGEDVLVGVGASGFLCLRASDGAARYFVKTGQRTLVAAAPEGDVVTAAWDGSVARWNGKALSALRPVKQWSATLGARPEQVHACGAGWHVRLEDGRAVLVDDTGAVKPEEWHRGYVTSEDGTVTAPAGWRFRADQAVRGAPVEGDVDGDGATDVVFGSDDHRVYVLEAGTGRFRWYYQAGNNVAAPVVLADLTGDGVPEVVFATTDGAVRAVSVASR